MKKLLLMSLFVMQLCGLTASNRLFNSFDEFNEDFNKEIKPLDPSKLPAIEEWDTFLNDQNEDTDKKPNADFSLFDGPFNLGNQVDFNNQADYDATTTKEVDVRLSSTAFSPIVLSDFEEEPHYYADQKIKRKKISERNSKRNDDEDEWKEEEISEQDIISYDDNPKRKQQLQESLYVRKVQDDWMCTFPECDKIYKTKGHLLKHIKSEHESVTYSCTKCYKTYKDQSGLSYHIKSQHEDITYLCTECNKTFTRKNGLRYHTKSQHEGITFSCTFCDKTFNDKSNLSRHIKSKHEGVTYSCTECNKTFSTKGNLSQHIKSQHEGITSSTQSK